MKQALKYAIFALIFILTASFSKAKTLTGEVELDWPLLNQKERNETINYYRNLLFGDIQEKIDIGQITDYKKDPNVRINRRALKEDIRNLGERELAGFYLFGKILVIYGVKYLNDKDNIYYYDALGGLKYIDIIKGNHDKFPYIAYQYNNKGKLVGASYYISEYDQYVFDEDGDFKGRWYFEKLYDKKAKEIMTRKLP